MSEPGESAKAFLGKIEKQNPHDPMVEFMKGKPERLAKGGNQVFPCMAYGKLGKTMTYGLIIQKVSPNSELGLDPGFYAVAKPFLGDRSMSDDELNELQASGHAAYVKIEPPAEGEPEKNPWDEARKAVVRLNLANNGNRPAVWDSQGRLVPWTGPFGNVIPEEDITPVRGS